MEETILQQKCDLFSVHIYQLNKILEQKKEFSISNQILRSGTSIGANVAESPNAESTEDFIHKLAITRKEANETQYWLRLIHNVQLIDDEYFKILKSECIEIQKILAATVKSVLSKNPASAQITNN